MKIANQWGVMGEEESGIRPATSNDAGAITNLLRDAPFTHVHADWHFPAEWLDSPAFVLLADPPTAVPPRSFAHGLFDPPAGVRACLAIAADPPPAAWVRVAAIQQPRTAVAQLAGMLASLSGHLRAGGVTQIGWLAVEEWPAEWFEELGFEQVNAVATYVHYGEPGSAAVNAPLGLGIRPVETTDLPALERIEAAAFEPLWRHSAQALGLAVRQTLSFDVAELDGRVVGFQFSTATRRGAHLSRMTVDPAVQRLGIGSALLAHALAGYKARGLRTVTLNTQIDNLTSQRLYERFGFRANGERFPVWAVSL